jgi:Xaa-Pro aminopeptidase
MAPDTVHFDEEARAAGLLAAQNSALALFNEAERGLIRPGVTERALSREIHALAADMFGVKAHWHKRVVRAGPNTLMPYNESPPNLTIQEDDILFLDLGPVFEAWEADFGRTYVLGNDPAKLRLRDDLDTIFAKTKAHFKASPDITGAELYAFACTLADEAGWEFGGASAGHLVGEFPHERSPGEKVASYIAPGNPARLSDPYPAGQKRHWILEIHLVDPARQIGGFYEELLTVE